MNKWLIVGGAAVVAVVGAFLVFKGPSTPAPKETETAAQEETASSEEDTEATEEEADSEEPAAAAPAAGETIIYQIQACVDEKATFALVGDKIQWSSLTGGGISSDGCSSEQKGKTTIQVTYNGESSEPRTFDIPGSDVMVGPLQVPIPAKELAAPATVEVSTDAARGSASVTGQPVSPWYRVQINFDDSDGFAHSYTVRLKLQYK